MVTVQVVRLVVEVDVVVVVVVVIPANSAIKSPRGVVVVVIQR